MKTTAIRMAAGLAAGIVLATAFNGMAEVAKPHDKVSNRPAVFKDGAAATQALRVAQVDALRQLAERVYGFHLNASTTVQDFMLMSDVIRARMETFLKGAAETEKPEYFDDGRVQVVYGVKLRDVVEVIKTEVSKSADGNIKEMFERSIENQDTLIEALGNGAVPGSAGMAKIQAKRAAEADAFRLMAERVVGVKITSETSVGKLCLENDQVMTSVSAYLKGLKPTDIAFVDDGSCEVTLQLKVRDVIETIERTVKYTKCGIKTTKEEVEKVNHDIVDRVFSVTGKGNPKVQVEAAAPAGEPTSSAEAFREEKIVLKRVIESGKVVVD